MEQESFCSKKSWQKRWSKLTINFRKIFTGNKAALERELAKKAKKDPQNSASPNSGHSLPRFNGQKAKINGKQVMITKSQVDGNSEHF